jgi:hypothetical protein
MDSGRRHRRRVASSRASRPMIIIDAGREPKAQEEASPAGVSRSTTAIG